MKITTKHPHETEYCRFTAVWENSSGTWSADLLLRDGELFEYDSEADDWLDEPFPNPHLPHNLYAGSKNFLYFISEKSDALEEG